MGKQEEFEDEGHGGKRQAELKGEKQRVSKAEDVKNGMYKTRSRNLGWKAVQIWDLKEKKESSDPGNNFKSVSI